MTIKASDFPGEPQGHGNRPQCGCDCCDAEPEETEEEDA